MLRKSFQFGLALALGAAMLGVNLVGAQEGDKPASPGRVNYRAKQIIGAAVNIEGDASVGTVDDIVLDDHGNVDYLIVANSDGKLVSVPWDATQFNVEKRMAVINISPEKYQAVPRYTAEQYPVYSTPAYRIQTYRYYGLTPGQERRAIRRGDLR